MVGNGLETLHEEKEWTCYNNTRTTTTTTATATTKTRSPTTVFVFLCAFQTLDEMMPCIINA